MPYVSVTGNYLDLPHRPAWSDAGIYSDVQGDNLAQIHILVTPPVHRNFYSDGHVTLQLRNERDRHIYYQVNNGRRVARDPMGAGWVGFLGFRADAEAEILALIQYTRQPVPVPAPAYVDDGDWPALPTA